GISRWNPQRESFGWMRYASDRGADSGYCYLERVSTVSDSDLVKPSKSRIITNIACSSLTRSLPLPVLTRSNNDPDLRLWLSLDLLDFSRRLEHFVIAIL